ncbi:unnamed protein product [Gongylonema pulchrum]|uniref:G_PROTEIN_RECEP_F1_2 domain-containing protein n=1 Tax=Gongylonema pulchrum TaxID=637853 RepID=A0A183EI08_9BILA|nr:unnamed protein product [Gongylonema pulchrum]
MLLILEVTLVANNWATFILGTTANLLVFYVCLKTKNVELLKNRWCIAMHAILQLIECFNLTFVQLVSRIYMLTIYESEFILPQLIKQMIQGFEVSAINLAKKSSWCSGRDSRQFGIK